MSAFQDEKRGFSLPLSADELAKINFFRQQEGRSPLKETPGLHFLLPGNNREGYWGFADFKQQTIDIMDCLKQIESGKQLVIEVDHSAGHAKYLPDGLHVANMNVKYGGKQKVLRDSVMTEGCLGPRPAKMYLNGGEWSTKFDPVLTTKTVDLKPKLCEVQRTRLSAPMILLLSMTGRRPREMEEARQGGKEGGICGKAEGEHLRGASRCGDAGGTSTACRQPPGMRKKTWNKFWVVCRT